MERQEPARSAKKAQGQGQQSETLADHWTIDGYFTSPIEQRSAKNLFACRKGH
jgi:hypothetical protein